MLHYISSASTSQSFEPPRCCSNHLVQEYRGTQTKTRGIDHARRRMCRIESPRGPSQALKRERRRRCTPLRRVRAYVLQTIRARTVTKLGDIGSRGWCRRCGANENRTNGKIAERSANHGSRKANYSTPPSLTKHNSTSSPNCNRCRRMHGLLTSLVGPEYKS